MFLSILKDIFNKILYVVGIITTVIAVYDFYKNWISKRNEERFKKNAVKNTDYFIAHIIHMGGEFSMTYSMQVFSNEQGGYYFNPPKDYVYVSFNRGGDSLVVTMPEFVQKAGFVIGSTGSSYDHLEKSIYPDICHLPIGSLKNEYFVKFVKLKIG
jgi:hypothetical protein